MLKADINKRTGKVSVIVAGDLAEAIEDVANVICAMHYRMKHSAHPEAADEFRRVMVQLHTDPNTPLFEDISYVSNGFAIVTEVPHAGQS